MHKVLLKFTSKITLKRGVKLNKYVNVLHMFDNYKKSCTYNLIET